MILNWRPTSNILNSQANIREYSLKTIWSNKDVEIEEVLKNIMGSFLDLTGTITDDKVSELSDDRIVEDKSYKRIGNIDIYKSGVELHKFTYHKIVQELYIFCYWTNKFADVVRDKLDPTFCADGKFLIYDENGIAHGGIPCIVKPPTEIHSYKKERSELTVKIAELSRQ